MTSLRIEKLARHHPVDGFDCGAEALNRSLVRFALTSQLANASQTYVALSDGVVVGYHTLVVGEVSRDVAPGRLRKGIANHPVPVLILARLAVDQVWKGKKVGAGLLKDAILRTLPAADIAGIRALVVHAKDDAARAFHVHFGFAQGFSDPMHLYILTKDLKALVSQG